MSNIFIFGYGSLIAAWGINGRNMNHIYSEKELKECVLNGYKRSFNANYGDHDLCPRFFGITREDGAKTNGVIFKIRPYDIRPFVASEGGDSVYYFVNVRDLITGLPNSFFGPKDRVFTCVTKHPSYSGKVSEMYIYRCARALSFRSPRFRKEFGSFNDYNPGRFIDEKRSLYDFKT